MCKLGVLGYGVVGQSVVRCATDPLYADKLHQIVVQRLGLAWCPDPLSLAVWDDKQLGVQQVAQLQAAGVAYVPGLSLTDFLSQVALVIPSPGLPPHRYAGKPTCSELALFQSLRPAGLRVMGITGSLGKTTVTKLITALLSASNPTQRCAMGGNVGLGMLDLLAQKVDCAVLELSSYQLYQEQSCASDVAVWTNLYPNHLDWHGTLHDYARAKSMLLAAQQQGQGRVLSAQLLLDPTAASIVVPLLDPHQNPTIIIAQSLQEAEACYAAVPRAELHFWYPKGGGLEQWCDGVISLVYAPFDQLPPVTFAQNWAMALAAVFLLQGRLVQPVEVSAAVAACPELTAGYEHRVELFVTYNDVQFFNDSKSTVQEATLTAAQSLVQSGRPLHVVLGGLGKGVDRSGLAPALRELPGVVQLVSWGPEAAHLQPSHTLSSLEQVVAHLVQTVRPGDQVLFSPSGASFDGFANYQERGKIFKELVHRAYQRENFLQRGA